MENSTRNNPIEIGQIGVHVQREPVHRNPAAHLDPESGDLLASNPNSGEALIAIRGNPVLRQCPDDDFLKITQIPTDIEIVIIEIENWIADKLTRTMIRYVATAVYVEHFYAPGYKLAVPC